MDIHTRLLMTLVVTAFFSCMTISTSAFARAPGEIEQDATELFEDVRAMEPGRLGTGFSGENELQVTDQLVEGVLAYALEDYDKTALVLAELVEQPHVDEHAGYPRALYLLGDSLYRNEDFTLSRLYYERLFELRDEEYSLDAGLRLVEVELKQQDIEAAVQWLTKVEARYGDVAGAGLQYVRGKVDYQNGDYRTAIQVLEQMEPETTYYARAQYLAGVSATKLGDLEEAHQRFSELDAYLEKQSGLSKADQTVKQLTELAQARLYYEEENWSDAVYHYAQVNPDSEQFDSALYEMSWTMINEERFRDAAYNLEVLAEISKDTRFIAEARLLAGNMKRRAKQYGEAEVLFEATGDDYEQIWRQMGFIIESDSSIASKYLAVRSIDTGGVQHPVDVEDWVSEDPRVARSLMYVRNAAEIQSWLAESQETITNIRRALSENNIYDVFPEASRFRGTMTTYWRESVDLRIEANEELYQMAEGHMTRAQVADYEDLKAERKAAESAFYDSNFRVVAGRGDNSGQSVNSMLEEMNKAEQELEKSLREVDELQVLLRQRLSRGDMTPAEVGKLQTDLQKTRVELQEQLADVRAQRKEALEASGRLRTSDDEGMRRLRELIAALKTERSMLRSVVESSGGDLQATYDKLNDVDRRLETLRGMLGDALRRRRNNYRQALNAEAQRVNGLEESLAAYTKQSAELMEGVAASSLKKAHKRIGEVVLRASLGTIDVSWSEKEAITQQIEQLFDEKSRQLQVLDADFAEILGGQ